MTRPVAAGDIRAIAEDLLALRHLVDAGHALTVPEDLPGDGRAGRLIGVAGALGLPLDLPQAGSVRSGAEDPIDRIARRRLTAVAAGLQVLEGSDASIASAAQAVLVDGWEAGRAALDASGHDGAALRSYAFGSGPSAVVIASACGMPARLTRRWVDVLAPDHRVITWETRGLFAGESPLMFDAMGCDVDAQAMDLLTVMDHHDVEQAHVMGLCGGAVLALRAASLDPHRVTSLSLWHGDYELGGLAEKTEHQTNLRALLDLAAEDRGAAEQISAALRSTAMSAVPDDVADLVVYPYTNAELFYRYCALTGAIMHADVAAMLAAVHQPALVVTSEDDATAHPDGSHVVAARLPRARLQVEPTGDHISVFGASPRLGELLDSFLAGLVEVPR